MAEHYGITKWEPPVKGFGGTPGGGTCADAVPTDPLFQAYTDIENFRNFPNVLISGEEVQITEKIHGTNCRVGAINGELVAGSMRVQRVKPANFETNTYWFPFTQTGVLDLVIHLAKEHAQVLLYGEVFGSHIQNLHYGEVGTLGFRAFDLLVDGQYLDYDPFIDLCAEFAVATAPLLYAGPYSREVLLECCKPKTTFEGADHIMEGVVVKPTVERFDHKIGRVALKYITDEYLFSKTVTDSRDV